MDRHGEKAQQLVHDTHGRYVMTDHIEGLIKQIEAGTLKRSLVVAVTWLNRFWNASPEGVSYHLGKVPQWIIDDV